jgi:hypothetical protein
MIIEAPCPTCGNPHHVIVACDICGEKADYAEVYTCECSRMLCIRHGLESAAEVSWNQDAGRDEMMCPVCLQVSEFKEMSRITLPKYEGGTAT